MFFSEYDILVAVCAFVNDVDEFVLVNLLLSMMLMNSFWSSVPAMCSFIFAMKIQVDNDKMINKIDRAVRDALFLTETNIAKDIIPENIQNSK
jgi:hypothetical protein